MKHGHNIGKISLVVRNKKNVAVGQVLDDFGPLYAQLIKSAIAAMGQYTQIANEHFFEKQILPKWIFCK